MLGQQTTKSIIIPSSQQIADSFQQSFDLRSHFLFQVPQQVAENIYDAYIIGTQDPVICTQSETYSVRMAETSNLLMLVKDTGEKELCTVSNAFSATGVDFEPTSEINTDFLMDRWDVLDCGSTFLEVLKITPTCDELISILAQNTYKGSQDSVYNIPIEEIQSQHPKTTFEFLKNTILASPIEIKSFLKDSNAIEIDGEWRLVDRKYMAFILTLLVFAIQETASTYSGVSWNTIWSSMKSPNCSDSVLQSQSGLDDDLGINEDIVRHCLITFSESCEMSHCGSVMRAFGENILAELGETWVNLSDFITDFTNCMPDLEVDLKSVEGLCLIENGQMDAGADSGTVCKIRYFPKNSLPRAPAARFAALFSVRKKWDKKDILPYIEELVGTGLEPLANSKAIDALILKFARISRVGRGIFLTNRFVGITK